MASAIDFTLKNQDDKDFTLSSLKGKIIVLYFYPQDETPGCTKEACSFGENFAFYKENDIEIVGISPDSTESHRKFIKNHTLPFTLLSDPDHTVMQKYAAYGEKVRCGRKSVGVIRKTVVIDKDFNIIKEYEKVNTATHGADVKKFLSSLK